VKGSHFGEGCISSFGIIPGEYSRDVASKPSLNSNRHHSYHHHHRSRHRLRRSRNGQRCIWQVLGPNFSRDKDYPEYFGGFPQSLQVNAEKGTLN
jgi:hypothetical protein